MPRRPANITQSDIARAIRAATAAGADAIAIRGSTIVVLLKAPNSAPELDEPPLRPIVL
jgi:hypothetical protein